MLTLCGITTKIVLCTKPRRGSKKTGAESPQDSGVESVGKRFLVINPRRSAETNSVKQLRAFGALLTVLLGCAAPPSGTPQTVEARVGRYLGAWQRADWTEVYRIEGRQPGERPILHDALTDSLAFYTINEVRYSDSAAACAVTLQWLIIGRPVTEAGEIYLSRTGSNWQVTGFKSF